MLLVLAGLEYQAFTSPINPIVKQANIAFVFVDNEHGLANAIQSGGMSAPLRSMD